MPSGGGLAHATWNSSVKAWKISAWGPGGVGGLGQGACRLTLGPAPQSSLSTRGSLPLPESWAPNGHVTSSDIFHDLQPDSRSPHTWHPLPADLCPPASDLPQLLLPQAWHLRC